MPASPKHADSFYGTLPQLSVHLARLEEWQVNITNQRVAYQEPLDMRRDGVHHASEMWCHKKFSGDEKTEVIIIGLYHCMGGRRLPE